MTTPAIYPITLSASSWRCSQMYDQIETVARRDGELAAIAYVKQTLQVYRQCSRRKPDGSKHFAHIMPYRPHFVRSIWFMRKWLRIERTRA